MWNPKLTLKEHERQIIQECLKHHGGNKIRSAKQLRMAVRTMRIKCNIYKLGCVTIKEARQRGYSV